MRTAPPPRLRPSARTCAGLGSLFAIASCLGDDEGAGGGRRVGEASGESVTECREIALHAEMTQTLAKTDDQELPVPTVLATVPATVEAVNPHPDVRALLWFQFNPTDGARVMCAYQCPNSGGACTSNTLELVGTCMFGGSYPGTTPSQAAGEHIAFTHANLTTVITSETPPTLAGTIEIDAALTEIGTCPSACSGEELDDEDDCTIDRCIEVEAVPTAVHTDVCGEELPDGVATTVGDALAGLLVGDPPLQQETGAIDLEIAAGITGQVLRHDGFPAAGAIVSIEGHDEYGWTETGADGELVMLVEGGGVLTVNVEAAGYLPVHRAVRPGWQGWARTDDVVLTPRSLRATAIDLDAIDGAAIAVGETTFDDDGERTGVLIVPEGTVATVEGAETPLEVMTLRITEYTVGEDGPARMPAPLPPESAYTYAAEIEVDEADGAGVTFDEPVFYYLENFLDFPVGDDVPVGRYDRTKRAWLPEDDGKIIRIDSISAGAVVRPAVGVVQIVG